MSDDSQLFVPPSFVAVHTLPGRIKPSLPAAELAQRYELCEDLAQMLAPQAGELQARRMPRRTRCWRAWARA